MSNVADNIKAIRDKIAVAAKSAGRDPAGVNLVAVSKMQSDTKINEALACGHRLFGENKVQEAKAHWEDLRKNYPDLRLHLIGPLQTNKVKDAVALFDVVETLDRPKLADALSAEMKKQGRRLPCFIQVNTGEEPQKAGITPEEISGFLDYCRGQGLKVMGLMCIPPVDEPPALHFALLRKLALAHDLKDLSMGMSNDFERAIPLGATYVRIGTAIFGKRTLAAGQG